jgi:hypothetical protein
VWAVRSARLGDHVVGGVRRLGDGGNASHPCRPKRDRRTFSAIGPIPTDPLSRTTWTPKGGSGHERPNEPGPRGRLQVDPVQCNRNVVCGICDLMRISLKTGVAIGAVALTAAACSAGVSSTRAPSSTTTHPKVATAPPTTQPPPVTTPPTTQPPPPPVTVPPTTQPPPPPVTAPPVTAPPTTQPPMLPVPGIPQGNGGDGDADNNGGPSDGDGNV